jgi:hypothetical protein
MTIDRSFAIEFASTSIAVRLPPVDATGGTVDVRPA